MSVRVTQEVFEVIVSADPNIRITQYVTESLESLDPYFRVTQYAIEVLRTNEILYERSLTSTLSLTSTVSLASIFSPSVTSTLTLTQDLTKGFTSSVTSTLSFTQSVSQPVYQSITFTSNVSETEVRSLSVTSTLSLTSDADGSLDNEGATSSVLSLTQSVTVQHVLNRSLTSTLSFTEIATRHNYFLTSTLTLTQSHTIQKIATRSITQNLFLTSTVVNQGILGFHITDTLEFAESFLRTLEIGDDVIEIPIVRFSIVPRICRVILMVPELNIILPCPLFGDTQANVSTMVLKRTMTGQIFTYVKNSELQKLKYDFRIDTNKAVELRNWIINYLSRLITLSNWKGEVWRVYMINNPIEEISDHLALETDEAITVTLEFEGAKI